MEFEDQNFKPTLPIKKATDMGKNHEKEMTKSIVRNGLPPTHLTEVDMNLNEKQESFKKKIWDLAKMEALVHSDERLSALYNNMADEGEDKYGYHYNETIMNIIFNEYVMNDNRFLQKYYMAVPVEKKRRDKSGIHQLQKQGQTGVDKARNKLAKERGINKEGELHNNSLEGVIEEEPMDNDLYRGADSGTFDDREYMTHAINKQYDTMDNNVQEHHLGTREEKIDFILTHKGDTYPMERLQSAPDEQIDDIYNAIEQEMLGVDETTGAASSGSFAAPLAVSKRGFAESEEEEEVIDETTSSASSGQFTTKLGTDGHSGKGGRDPKLNKPAWEGGEIIGESNYLTDPSGFEKFLNEMEEIKEDFNDYPLDQSYYDQPSMTQGLDMTKVPTEMLQRVQQELSANAKKYGNTANNVKLMQMIQKFLGVSESEQPNVVNRTDGSPNTNVKYGGRIPTNNGMKTPDKPIGDPQNFDRNIINKGKNPKLDIPKIDEKAKSKNQQQFMGMVHAAQKGELEDPSPAVEKAADSINYDDAEDFAATKHKGLPEKVPTDEASVDSSGNVVGLGAASGDPTKEEMVEFLKQEYGSQYDDFDAEEAIYWFGYEYHGGQTSNMYSALSTSEYRPSQSMGSSDDIEDTSKEMYEDLVMHFQSDMLTRENVGEGVVMNEWNTNVQYVKYLKPYADEEPFTFRNQKYEYVWAEYPDGRRDIAVYSQSGDLTYGYQWWREAMGIDKPANESMANGREDDPTTMASTMKDVPAGGGGSDMGMGFGGIGEAQQEVKVDDNNPLKDFGNSNQGVGGHEGTSVKDINHNAEPIEPKTMNKMRENVEARTKCDDDEERVAGKSVHEKGGCKNKKGAGEQTIMKSPKGEELSDRAKNPSNVKARIKRMSKYEKDLEAKKGEYSQELEKHKQDMNKLKSTKKNVTEEKKHSSMVNVERIGKDNKKNFDKDIGDSNTEMLKVKQDELTAQDQITKVPENPYQMGQDIEKEHLKNTNGLGFKNVGDSTNEAGDEIPKRNLTSDEEELLNLYRKGQHSWNYDSEPSKRFVERMKNDMGEETFELMKKQMEFVAKAPMYNKDPQPTEETAVDKAQFDKYKTGWNDKKGLKMEGVMSAKYKDEFGKNVFLNFNVNEAEEVGSIDGLTPLNLDGMGNSYTTRVHENKNMREMMDAYKFYINGQNKIKYAKTGKQTLSENIERGVQVVNEEFTHMKKLISYNPSEHVDTSNIKKNRGF